MDDPVTEIGCKNFARLGISHDEADRFAGLVVSALQRFCERYDVCAELSLELLRVHGAALASAAVDVSLENVCGGKNVCVLQDSTSHNEHCCC